MIRDFVTAKERVGYEKEFKAKYRWVLLSIVLGILLVLFLV